MYKACRAILPCRLGRFSTKSSGKDDKIVVRRRKACKQAPCVTVKYRVPRAPLPWEGGKRHCVKVCEEPKPDPKCEFCEKVRRLKYTWDVHEEDPCKPYVQATVLEKTICEIRRFQRCMSEIGSPSKCNDLPPLGKGMYKVYPMKDVVEKSRLPGCIKPIEPYKRPEPKSAEAEVEPHPKPYEDKENPPKCKEDIEEKEQKPNWEPKRSLHNKDCPGKETPMNPGIVGDNQNIIGTDK